jgi:hypothetical protein
MLKKIGRWTASRLQGSKGKAKYDDWMKRNPWASTALTVGDIALTGYAAPKLIGGLKGILTAQAGQTAAGAPAMASQAADVASAVPMPSSVTATAPRVSLGDRARAGFQAAKSAPSMYSAGGRAQAGQGLRDIGGSVMRGGRAVAEYAKANPLASAMALEGLLSGQQNAQQMRLERERERREQERRETLAQLLMPTFAQYYRGE